MAQQTDWVLVTDKSKARLLTATRDSNSDRLSMTEHAATELTFVESEHGRPSPRINKDGHSYASRNHEEAEQGKQAARQVAAFMQRELRETPARLHVLAPPKFLGFLRKELSSGIAGTVCEHVGEYSSLSPTELARHKVAQDFCQD